MKKVILINFFIVCRRGTPPVRDNKEIRYIGYIHYLYLIGQMFGYIYYF